MKNIKDKVSEPCFFRVTHKQMEHIQKQFQESGMKSFSAFLRQRVVHGIYLEFDRSELQNIRKTVQSSSSSINYITVRANSTKRIYDADVVELKVQLNIIHEQLRYILSLLQKVAQYIIMKRKRCTDGDDKISESCFFRVTPNEMYVIEERFKQSGMKSFSAFLRQQVVCGLYLQFDIEERIMIQNSIASCSHNINQIDIIARRDRKFVSEVESLKQSMNDIWNTRLSIDSILFDVGAIAV